LELLYLHKVNPTLYNDFKGCDGNHNSIHLYNDEISDVGIENCNSCLEIKRREEQQKLLYNDIERLDRQNLLLQLQKESMESKTKSILSQGTEIYRLLCISLGSDEITIEDVYKKLTDQTYIIELLKEENNALLENKSSLMNQEVLVKNMESKKIRELYNELARMEAEIFFFQKTEFFIRRRKRSFTRK